MRVSLVTLLGGEILDYDIITVQQLQALLAQSKGAKIVTIVTITHPELKKDTPEEYNGIRKISRVNGIVNWQYGKAVNKQREKEGKEGNFEPQKWKWGTRLSELPFVSHVDKGGSHKLYLELKVERVLSTEYKNNKGEVVLFDELEPYLRNTSSLKEYQGVKKEIVCRDYLIDNIVTIDIDGSGYILRG